MFLYMIFCGRKMVYFCCFVVGHNNKHTGSSTRPFVHHFVHHYNRHVSIIAMTCDNEYTILYTIFRVEYTKMVYSGQKCVLSRDFFGFTDTCIFCVKFVT